MIKYKMLFKDFAQHSYEAKISVKGYDGPVQQLRAAPSAFVVQMADEDFVYTPVRTSTASIRVLTKDVLTDLYSINNHFAAVQLYKDGVLEWTGYVKPEQYTQAYVNTVGEIDVDCVSAMQTLEHIEYKKKTEKGFISIWQLMKELIAEAAGGYTWVYMPKVYRGHGVVGNTLEHVMIAEENFTKDNMNCMEVLEHLCNFLNWTMYDLKGCIYFVDADWKGTYMQYDEQLNAFTTVLREEVLLQDVGLLGTDSNTLDVVKGYNKASVKSINNVFEHVVNNEMYEECKEVGGFQFLRGKHYLDKIFLAPKLWEVHSYDENLKEIAVGQFPIEDAENDENTFFGAVLTREATCEGKETEGVLHPDCEEFPYVDAIQMRYRKMSSSYEWLPDPMDKQPKPGQLMPDEHIGFTDPPLRYDDERTLVLMKGATLAWNDCAIGVDAQMRLTYDERMTEYLPDGGKREFPNPIYLRTRLKIGDYYFDGKEWGTTPVIWPLKFVGDHQLSKGGWLKVESNKRPDTKVGKGLMGFTVPLPDGVMGRIEFHILPFDYRQVVGNELLLAGTGIVLKEVKFTYAKNKNVDTEGESGDRVYENVVNEDYMTECEEISFGIGSYNGDGATFSKAMMDGHYMERWYNEITKEEKRPEELMIQRIVNRYGVSKIKLTEGIMGSDAVTPISVLMERSQPGKKFILTGGEWNYEQNRINVQMQEDAE